MKKVITLIFCLFLTACDKDVKVDGVFQGYTMGAKIEYLFVNNGDNTSLSFSFMKRKYSFNCHFPKDDKTQLNCIGNNNISPQTFTVKNEETLLNQRGEVLSKVK